MLLKPISQIVNHDIKLYARKGGELTTIIGFFAISLALFPFAMGAQNPEIPRYAPGFIWIIALLSSLLSLPALFHRDAEDGSLDQLRLSGLALEWCVLAKCSANWISCHLPLILLSPLPALMFGMTGEGASRLMLSLLLGTPVLSLLGALGAALTLHAANKSGVLAVLVLPLFIPALIFGSMFALTSAETSAFEVSEFYMLCGLLLMSLPFSCWFSAWIIRLQD